MIYNHSQFEELLYKVNGGIASIRIQCASLAEAERLRQALYRKSRLMGVKVRISLEPDHNLVLSPIGKLDHEPA